MVDLTEIEGADNLHDARGILREAMDRTAELWGSARTWYLVGGSTCGILAGIRAIAPFGSELIVARNSHKSVYHAIELGAYTVHWLFPSVEETYEICGSIRPETVGEMVRRYPQSAAVVVTSPTYEGVISDIASIATVCHKEGISLFVDEAHGAHLGLFREGAFPESALRLGADLVVQSAHKTLPALTQTALLHLQGTLVDQEEVERQLNIFETSSPSYPLMISLDSCTGILREQGTALFADWRERLRRFDERLRELDALQVLCHGADRISAHSQFWEYDPGKILIRFQRVGLTGAKAAEILRRKYGIELEMAQGNNALAMTGCGDGSGDLERFADALLAMDRRMPDTPSVSRGPAGDRTDLLRRATVNPVLSIAEAVCAPRETVRLEEAVGRICAEYLYMYPPGVPLLAPGEEIGQVQIELLVICARCGEYVFHSVSGEEGTISVLQEGRLDKRGE